MAKDDDLPKRIEGVFERTGLGNMDPERLMEQLEQYQKAMNTADRVRARQGKDFEEILNSASELNSPEEG